MYIQPTYNNIDLTLGSYSGTSHGSPLTPQAGGYFEGTTGGPAFTGIFSVKGTGANTSIKGTFQYVNPYVIMSGKFSLKRAPTMNSNSITMRKTGTLEGPTIGAFLIPLEIVHRTFSVRLSLSRQL